MNRKSFLKNGYLAALSAYVFWGFTPIFWKLLIQVPAIEILAHRVIWSFPFLLWLVYRRGEWQVLRKLVQNPRRALPYVISGALLAVNWYTYIWAVNNSYIVEASLGYFINPLVNVLLGMIFLKERLRSVQWLALLTAFAGVGYLAFSYGQIPWISLILATTFSLYGLLRKTGKLNALDGLTVEMAALIVPALILLGALVPTAHPSPLDHPAGIYMGLILTGAVTALPLLWFAYGARRITLSALGFMQYIAPTMQFLLGVFLYNEVFTRQKFIGFAFIWGALIIYSVENILYLRRKSAVT